MATRKEYMEFMMDQLSALGDVYYRRMMGEYLIYYRDKLVAYVCDERLLIRPVPSALRILPYAEYDSISEGGKKKYLRVDDVDDRKSLIKLFTALYDELPCQYHKD